MDETQIQKILLKTAQDLSDLSKSPEEILKEEIDNLNFISELSKRNIEKYIR